MDWYGRFVIREEEFGWGVSYPVEELVYNSGRWYVRILDCYNSIVVGGTCQCDSHSPYETRSITRRQAQEVVIEGNFHLTSEWTHEMDEDLNCIGVPQWDLEEVLYFRGMTFVQLEDWVKVSYELDVNPLPGIRKMLKDAGVKIPVKYTHWHPSIEFDVDVTGMVTYTDCLWAVVPNDGKVYLTLETKEGVFLERENFGEENPLPY